jgi:hypothetical protein
MKNKNSISVITQQVGGFNKSKNNISYIFIRLITSTFTMMLQLYHMNIIYIKLPNNYSIPTSHDNSNSEVRIEK